MQADFPLGYIHLADVLEADNQTRHQAIDPRRIRALGPVSAKAPVRALLAALRGSGSHMARVVEEHGQTRAIMAPGNVFGQLVGEVPPRPRASF
jgi:CBS domain containing-hemolysin-like protein